MSRYDDVATEDLLTFLAAATTSTGQREFYDQRDDPSAGLALNFLHEYVCGNYRDLYAGTLALRINDYNAAMIIRVLLTASHLVDPAVRRREGQLIAARLAAMAPQRVYRLLAAICRDGRNNRRLRAITKQWLARRDLAFDTVKYRRHLRIIVRHLHLQVPPEIAIVLTGRWRQVRSFTTPILDTWRRSHYDNRALLDLPHTVAEGLAATRRVARTEVLARGNLTANERSRLITSGAHHGVQTAPLGALGLTRLTAYVLSLAPAERSERRDELTTALTGAAQRLAGPIAGTWGSVVAVLDDSYSTSGSDEKHQRPLVVALAAHYLLRALAGEYRSWWTSGRTDALLVTPRGVTDLAGPVLAGLSWAPDRLVVVSDGVDNAPAGAAAEVLRVWSAFTDGATAVVHLNPVFDAGRYEPRQLAPRVPAIPTLGIRDVEDLPLLVELANFATGQVGHDEFSAYLAAQVTRCLAAQGVPA